MSMKKIKVSIFIAIVALGLAVSCPAQAASSQAQVAHSAGGIWTGGRARRQTDYFSTNGKRFQYPFHS